MTQLAQRCAFRVRRLTWRSAAGIAGVLTLALVLTACDRDHSARPPIVFLMVDTLRADYLGVYGFQGDISPNLDRFASESIVFRNCFSQAPWTKPSIASLFTSLRVPVHGLRSHGGRFGRARGERKGEKAETDTLDERVVTLAEALGAGDYATGAFVANPWIQATHGFGQGFDVFDSKGAGNVVTAERPINAALQWLEGLSEEQPFFLYLHLMDVHGPYEASDEDYDALRESPSLGENKELGKKELERMPKYLRSSRWFPRGNLRDVRAHYAADIRALDRRLDAFFDALRARNIMDKAVIVLTADHGEQLYEHGRWDHGYSLYDEELHVPLIIRLPGAGNAGASISRIVSLIDVMPTLLALAGVPGVEGMQGEDLSALLRGKAGAEADPATFATAVKWKPGLYSARTKAYKLIKDVPADAAELYDVRQDPAERRNIMSDSAALESMQDLLEDRFAENERREALEPGSVEVPADVQERLRALGYDH